MNNINFSVKYLAEKEEFMPECVKDLPAPDEGWIRYINPLSQTLVFYGLWRARGRLNRSSNLQR